MINSNKRQSGQFYTRQNPFDHPAFRAWAKEAGLPHATLLEPFAGRNHIIQHLVSMGLCHSFASFDIHPRAAQVSSRDTLAVFPKGYEVCVTNPPWLAKNSASRRRLPFPPKCRYDDLYKHALEKCLAHCGYVAVLLPESFIRSGLFHQRLTDFISLTARLFADTAHPVGLALFTPRPSADVTLWSDRVKIGRLNALLAMRPQAKQNAKPIAVRFNVAGGNVGLLALDNTREASIRFCDVRELGNRHVRVSDRAIARLAVAGEVRLAEWNACLAKFRQATHDVFMTAYRGVRQDGMYRRRLDWDLARGIIQHIG